MSDMLLRYICKSLKLYRLKERRQYDQTQIHCATRKKAARCRVDLFSLCRFGVHLGKCKFAILLWRKKRQEHKNCH